MIFYHSTLCWNAFILANLVPRISSFAPHAGQVTIIYIYSLKAKSKHVNTNVQLVTRLMDMMNFIVKLVIAVAFLVKIISKKVTLKGALNVTPCSNISTRGRNNVQLVVLLALLQISSKNVRLVTAPVVRVLKITKIALHATLMGFSQFYTEAHACKIVPAGMVIKAACASLVNLPVASAVHSLLFALIVMVRMV